MGQPGVWLHGSSVPNDAGGVFLKGGIERRKGGTHQFENDEEEVVDNKGPFPTVAIAGDTEDDGADGTEHLGEVRGVVVGELGRERERTRTRVMPQVMSVFDLSNCSASSVTVRETVKKSKASHVCRSCEDMISRCEFAVRGHDSPRRRTRQRRTPIACDSACEEV
jgi:hypothetical protein